MKLLLVFFFFFSCLRLTVSAQLDSMLKVLAGEKDDSNKVKTLSRISQYYYSVEPLKSFPYANQALQLAEKIKWKKGIANLSNNLGLYISDTGNNALGRKYYAASYTLNLELDAKANQVNNLNNIGRSYMVESAYTGAADNFFKALAIAEKLNDNDLVALVAGNIANCFSVQNDYAKAARYAEMELDYGTRSNSTRRISHALMALGNTKFHLHDTAAAKTYAERALKIAEETHNRVDEANVLINLANYYVPDYRRQIELMLRVNTIMDEISPASETSLVNNANLGDTYVNLAAQNRGAARKTSLEKAGYYLQRAKSMAEKTNSPGYLASIFKMLEHFEEENGNYKTAMDYYKSATAINDSLFSQEKKNEIAGLEGKHNLAVKDKEIAINQLMLASQRKTQWALMAGLMLLVVIGALLYRQSRNRKKTNAVLMALNNQLDEANKVKATFFSILSHDLRSPIVNLVHFLDLQKEHPGMLNENQQAAHRQNIGDAADSLLNNMEAMLLWSKEQMESFRPVIKNIPVQVLFDYLQTFFQQDHAVAITFDAPAGLMVNADENYLRTIMQNLTANALRMVKEIPGGSVAWKAKSEGTTTILSITDNGPAIAESQSKALFDEMVTGNTKSGLGLHLVRDLARAIHYDITVQAEPGRGTTFVLSGKAAS